MEKRTIIYAEDGHILTNGEIYGRQIFLAEGVSAEDFYEITDEEYQKILDEQRAATEATISDP